MVRVAFVGAGKRAVAHMVAVANIQDAELVAISDISEDIGRAAQVSANSRLGDGIRPIDARFFTDFGQMAEAVDFDAVYLSLPPFVHGDIDHQVVDSGKAVFIEKPLAVHMGVAMEIASHIKESGVVNSVGHQMRYSPIVRQAVELVRDVPIGMAISIRLSGLGQTPWWRVQNKSGGMLIEQHVHAVDLMRILCGEIESVYAVGNTLLSSDVENVDIYDVNSCTVRFANGAPGIIGNSCAAPTGAAVFPPHQVHVVAQDMVLSVNPRKSTIRRAGAEPQELLSDQDGTYLMNQAFIQAVKSGSQEGILCDYDDALRSFAVTYACQQSAQTGKVINVGDLLSMPT